MRSVWGAGYGDAPPAIFQTPEEFRRQGHLYRGLRWLSVDEARPTSGVEGDIFKVFVTGGPLCLRKNHESETHHATWAKCGKSWAMNPDDAPYVPSAERNLYKRRLRCLRMRPKFSASQEESGPGNGIFLADDSIRDWVE